MSVVLVGIEVGRLTAMMLKKPITEVIIPDAMTIRQSGRPKFSTLVAGLLR